MSAISSLPIHVTAWLRAQEVLQDIRFVTEYPARVKEIPLKRPIVAVGLAEVTITDKFTENDNGVLERQEYCRSAMMGLRLQVHVPESMGGEKCHEIFTTVIDCLTFGSDLKIVESGCENVTSDRNTDAFVLPAFITVEADFCPAQSEDISFGSFMQKDLLCGSHIGNDSIHVTPADKAKWNDAFQFGFYLGSGESSAVIHTAFAPRAVWVMCDSYPPMVVDFDNKKAVSYFGFGTKNNASQGVELTSNGFRLRSGQNLRGVSCGLNELGISYFFIAIR